jgi:uncharacterized RDD family membrane protein YckC
MYIAKLLTTKGRLAMSTTAERQIEQALAIGDATAARLLLRDALKDEPSGHLYFLAAQAALDDAMRYHYLQRALSLEPGHEGAQTALQNVRDRLGGVPPLLRQVEAKWANEQADDTGKPTFIIADDLEYAGFFPRLLAAFLDVTIATVVAILFSQLFVAVAPNGSLEVFYGLSFVLGLILNVVIPWRTNGQTLGKMVFGLRMVRLDGEPMSLWRAFLRNYIGYFLSSLFFLAGYFAIFFSPRRRGWHDLLAGTVVVRYSGKIGDVRPEAMPVVPEEAV